jgi:hypothetical protein
MGENLDKLVSKDVCEEREKASNNKFADMKANILTSKESLSNRIDEIDVALLGDRRDPGGLLRDIVEMQNEIERHEKSVQTEMQHHEESIAKDMKYLSKIAWIAMGLSVIAMGGRFFGISIDTIKGIFNKKEPTPISAPAPKIEEDETVPQEIKDYIQKELEKPRGK